VTAVPVDQPRPRRARLDIPEIKPVSWLGLESVAFWTPVIAHIIKWAVSFGYFVAFQLRYTIYYDKQNSHHNVVSLTDPWDRLPSMSPTCSTSGSTGRTGRVSRCGGSRCGMISVMWGSR